MISHQGQDPADKPEPESQGSFCHITPPRVQRALDDLVLRATQAIGRENFRAAVMAQQAIHQHVWLALRPDQNEDIKSKYTTGMDVTGPNKEFSYIFYVQDNALKERIRTILSTLSGYDSKSETFTHSSVTRPVVFLDQLNPLTIAELETEK